MPKFICLCPHNTDVGTMTNSELFTFATHHHLIFFHRLAEESFALLTLSADIKLINPVFHVLSITSRQAWRWNKTTTGWIGYNQQPNASPQNLNPQSSYSKTIPLLHSEVPLASEVNHNVSPETAPTEAIILATKPPKTETEITEEIQNIESEVSEAPQDTVEALRRTLPQWKGRYRLRTGQLKR